MLKKEVSLILVLILMLSVCGFTKKSSAYEIGKNIQPQSLENISSQDDKIFFTKAKMLSDKELAQYNQLQDQASQNSIFFHNGGDSRGTAETIGKVTGYILMGIMCGVLVVALVAVISTY